MDPRGSRSRARATLTCGYLFDERGQQIGLLREDRDELAAASDHRVDLAVDVRVIDSDDGELDSGCCARGRRGRLLRALLAKDAGRSEWRESPAPTSSAPLNPRDP